MSIFCLISMKVSSIPFLVIVSSAKNRVHFQASNWFLCGREKIRRRKLSRWIFSHAFYVTNNGTVLSPLQNVLGLAFSRFSFLYAVCITVLILFRNIPIFVYNLKFTKRLFFQISVLRHHTVITQYIMFRRIILPQFSVLMWMKWGSRKVLIRRHMDGSL